MKKILFAIKRLDKFGGAERVIVNLAGAFAARGYDTLLVTFVGDDCIYPVGDGVRLINLSTGGDSQSLLYRLRAISRFRKLLKRERPDGVVSFQFDFNIISLVASAGTGVPVIASERNDPAILDGKKLFKLLRRLIYPRADGFVFQTEEARDYFPERITRKSAVISNPVRGDIPDERDDVYDGNIITIGRLSRQKRHDVLIRAFGRIGERYPENELHIYGDGELKEDLESLIEQLGLVGRVFVHPSEEDILDTLKTASMFVLSSDYEGMPNVLIEALCLGVPCISTDCPCGGPKTLITDGENGFLVPVGDDAALAEKMDRLLSDRSLMERFSKCSYGRRDRYSLDNIYVKWKEYAEEVFDKK